MYRLLVGVLSTDRFLSLYIYRGVCVLYAFLHSYVGPTVLYWFHTAY